MTPPDARPTRSWMTSDRAVPRLIVRPVRDFLDTEVAGGLVLLAAALIALVWANSPFGDVYESFWDTELAVRVGEWSLVESLREWVNDGLMALFFFVVGLEIKRELVKGELSDPKAASLPVIAALGGMVVPALLYLVLTPGGEAGHGWGIPMATDIAFALGVLALFGRRIPSSLRVFLLSLAIVDDIGAILVIALVYTPQIEVAALALAMAGLAIVASMRVLRVWWTPAYALIGAGVWLATLQSGVHATIAGVVLGLMTPVRALDPNASRDLLLRAGRDDRDPIDDSEDDRALVGNSSEKGRDPANDNEDDRAPVGDTGGDLDPGEEEDRQLSPHEARRARTRAQASVSVAERIAHDLHPWTSYLVIPLFALANAGVELSGEALEAALASPVTVGVVLGLVAGKLIGVTGFAWAAERLGWATLPPGVGWFNVMGVAAIAGIGFTVSIFVSGLAFSDDSLVGEAKVGILIGSLAAAGLGALLILWGSSRPSREPAEPIGSGADPGLDRDMGTGTEAEPAGSGPTGSTGGT
nr:Na+/H+ antiporter NhaA [Actinomycetota bacterium]